MKIGSIVIHCHDFDRTVAFWQAALHYVPREPAKDGWVVLRDPEDKGPNLSISRIGAPRPPSALEARASLLPAPAGARERLAGGNIRRASVEN